MDKVSIIVPIYNTPNEYLKSCINSLIEQTHQEIEIIMIDDGSEYETAKLCEELAKKDNRIRLIHKENEGVSVARNMGIESAKGKWICFCDSDDLFAKDAIKVLINSSKNADIVISRIRREKNNRILGYSKPMIPLSENDKKELINSIFFDKDNKFAYVDSACSKLYLKSFLDNNKLRFRKGLTYGEDGLFNFNCYYLAKNINYIPAVLYQYRMNHFSVTQSVSSKIVKAHDELFKVYNNLLSDTQYESFHKAYYFYIVRQLDKFCQKYIFNHDNTMKNKERRNELMQIVIREPYQTAIKEVNTSRLPLKRRLLIHMIRMKLYWLANVMYDMNGIKNKIISFLKSKINAKT